MDILWRCGPPTIVAAPRGKFQMQFQVQFQMQFQVKEQVQDHVEDTR
jgi:hypothetical protein